MIRNRLKIIIDTNVLLVAISPHSQYHWILEELIAGDYEIYISNEILLEYEEIISQRYDKQLVDELFELFLVLPNVFKISPYFHWNLIINDSDDNKFVDCAVSGNVYCIVTHDKDFNVLKRTDFPKIKVCKIDDFKKSLFLHINK
ncbi:MAG: putative toxin-antitoxin system toxin component, PIN family [Bacteroidetes bacterium]|nr:MAG: putative toxin-antitoxin system toxin component, PIN family [Bacteroidota bacterium]